MKVVKSMIGGYGAWAGRLAENPARFSFRRPGWESIEVWRRQALSKANELIAAPDSGRKPDVSVDKRYEFDGLLVEELSWQLPYGGRTEAVLLKPRNVKKRLPAILALHDHGGNKYFGKRKIVRTSDSVHPMVVDHQQQYYGGRAWANEAAKRGYVVLVHDAFAFASRRVLVNDMLEIPGGIRVSDESADERAENPENITRYNAWASEHEHIMAKSLFCAGTTWPGVFFSEDKQALEILLARDDVDSERVGCAGLSGGGLRTVYLAGLDHRVRCAIAVGFMSTWTDFLMNKAYIHTWMTYTPLLPRFLDFPEILGLRAPLPSMVMNCNEDELYTLPEMRKADGILREVYDLVGAPEKYSCGYYSGGHKFDVEMQDDAFGWFEKWLS